jgi:nitroimidazol reductase NimA-like FMN-containing flavoprotein (pyridoxamine 5'-phosphate oxidase superfamily)
VTSWNDLHAAAPEFAAACRARIERDGIALLASLRADGFPRVSGVEPLFHAGELTVGMMPGSRKALDLRRDPRCALHAATTDKEVAAGDVKLTGRAREVTRGTELDAYLTALHAVTGWAPAPAAFHLFFIDLVDVTRVLIEDGAMHLDTWRPEHGLTRTTRRDD